MPPHPGVREVAARRLTFRTRQVDDPPGFVRTFGTVVHAGTGALRFGDDAAIAHAHPNPPPGCARDKVAAFSRHGRWGEAVCYQLSEARTKARVVGCSNATAAAAALYAHPSSRPHVRLRVTLPGGHDVAVAAHVAHDASGSRKTVRQTWTGLPFSVRAAGEVDGRSCAVCVGPLNDYLIVLARPGEAAGEIPATEAVGLWSRLGLLRDALLSRIAVVDASSPRVPRARFLTCEGREHPSAPLTGLAVLALAAKRLEWLPTRDAACLGTRAGPMRLPRVRLSSGGTASVRFPPLVVDVDRGPA